MSSDLVDGRGAVAFPTNPNDVTTGLSRSGSSTETLNSLTVTVCGSRRKVHLQLPDKTRQGEPIHWERTHDLLDPACESPTGWMRFLRLKITNPASHRAWRRGPVPTHRCISLGTRSRIGRVQYIFDLRPYHARCVSVSWGLASMVPNGSQLRRRASGSGKTLLTNLQSMSQSRTDPICLSDSSSMGGGGKNTRNPPETQAPRRLELSRKVNAVMCSR